MNRGDRFMHQLWHGAAVSNCDGTITRNAGQSEGGPSWQIELKRKTRMPGHRGTPKELRPPRRSSRCITSLC